MIGDGLVGRGLLSAVANVIGGLVLLGEVQLLGHLVIDACIFLAAGIGIPVPARGAGHHIHRAGRSALGVKLHRTADVNDIATRGLHQIIDNRHAHGCANGGLAAHGAALGGGGGDGFLLGCHLQIAAQRSGRCAQMRGSRIAHHSHGGCRRDGHATIDTGFGGRGCLVIGLGVKGYILGARQRGAGPDDCLGAVGHHIDCRRGTNAQLVAGDRCMWRGLGAVVAGAGRRHGHIAAGGVQRAIPAHSGLAGGIGQVQGQRTGQAHGTCAPTGGGLCQRGMGQSRVQRHALGIDGDVLAQQGLRRRAHAVHSHGCANAHLGRAARHRPIALGHGQRAAIGSEQAIHLVPGVQREGTDGRDRDTVGQAGFAARILQVQTRGGGHGYLAFAGAGRGLAVLLIRHGGFRRGLLFAVANAIGGLVLFCEVQLLGYLAVYIRVFLAARIGGLVPAAGTGHHGHRAGRFPERIERRRAAGSDVLCARGLHHIVHQGHAHGRADGGLAAHRAALGRRRAGGLLLDSHVQISRDLQVAADARAGVVAHNGRGGCRGQRDAAFGPGFGRGRRAVLARCVQPHIAGILQACAGNDVRSRAVGDHIDRGRCAYAHLVAGRRFSGLGADRGRCIAQGLQRYRATAIDADERRALRQPRSGRHVHRIHAQRACQAHIARARTGNGVGGEGAAGGIRRQAGRHRQAVRAQRLSEFRGVRCPAQIDAHGRAHASGAIGAAGIGIDCRIVGRLAQQRHRTVDAGRLRRSEACLGRALEVADRQRPDHLDAAGIALRRGLGIAVGGPDVVLVVGQVLAGFAAAALVLVSALRRGLGGDGHTVLRQRMQRQGARIDRGRAIDQDRGVGAQLADRNAGTTGLLASGRGIRHDVDAHDVAGLQGQSALDLDHGVADMHSCSAVDIGNRDRGIAGPVLPRRRGFDVGRDVRGRGQRGIAACHQLGRTDHIDAGTRRHALHRQWQGFTGIGGGVDRGLRAYGQVVRGPDIGGVQPDARLGHGLLQAAGHLLRCIVQRRHGFQRDVAARDDGIADINARHTPLFLPRAQAHVASAQAAARLGIGDDGGAFADRNIRCRQGDVTGFSSAQCAADSGLAVGDDLYGSTLNDHRRGRGHSLRIDYLVERGLRPDELRAAVDGAADLDGTCAQRHAVDGIDAALNGNQAVRVARCRATEQLRHRCVVRQARAEEVVDELLRWRADMQRANIDHTAVTHHQPMRIDKPDVAANRAIAHGVEHSVNLAARAADQIDQVAGARRQMHVGGHAGLHIELGKGVECVDALDSLSADVHVVADRAQGGLGAAVNDNTIQGSGQRRRQRHGADVERQQRRQPPAPGARLAPPPGHLRYRYPEPCGFVPYQTVDTVHGRVAMHRSNP